MGDLTKHFSKHEFACKCGCNLMNASEKLLKTLETIRERIGLPVCIESGTRCAKHNAKVGGAQNSAHITGEAADIYVKHMSNRDLGMLIKGMHRRSLLPHLRYCYLITGNSNTRVHVGVDAKPRKGVFGF